MNDSPDRPRSHALPHRQRAPQKTWTHRVTDAEHAAFCRAFQPFIDDIFNGAFDAPPDGDDGKGGAS